MFIKSTIAACCLFASFTCAQAAESTSSAPIVVAQSVDIRVGTEPRAGRPHHMRRTVVRTEGPRYRRGVVVRHDRGMHRGWRHAPAYGARRTTIIKKTGPLGLRRTKTVIQSN